MPVSLHSHSGQYCEHGYGELEQVVQKAVQMGFVCFGLSEHMPRSSEEDLYPEEIELRYTPSSLATTSDHFVSHARRLINQYQTPATSLLLGIETEYIRASDLDLVSQLRANHHIDYIVGSVHHVAGVPIDYQDAVFTSIEHLLGGTETVFKLYFNAQYEMLQALKPDVVGHFDLVRLFRPNHLLSEVVWGLIERNIKLIVSYGGLVEINSRALKKNLPFPYPFKDILQKMIFFNVKFTLSDDAHGPNDVAMHFDKLRDYLVEMGIHSIFYLTKIDGQVITVELPDVVNHLFWSNNNLISVNSSNKQSPLLPSTSLPIVTFFSPISQAWNLRSPSSRVTHSVVMDDQPKLPGAFPTSSLIQHHDHEINPSLNWESKLASSVGKIDISSDNEQTPNDEPVDYSVSSLDWLDDFMTRNEEYSALKSLDLSPLNSNFHADYEEDDYVLVDAKDALDL